MNGATSVSGSCSAGSHCRARGSARIEPCIHAERTLERASFYGRATGTVRESPLVDHGFVIARVGHLIDGIAKQLTARSGSLVRLLTANSHLAVREPQYDDTSMNSEKEQRFD